MAIYALLCWGGRQYFSLLFRNREVPFLETSGRKKIGEGERFFAIPIANFLQMSCTGECISK